MRLRAAVVGAGSIGAQHARVLASLEGVVLVDVVDPAHAGNDLYGVKVRSDIPPQADRIWDYAVIAVPSAAHESVALEMCRLGIPALIEKPLAPSPESASRIALEFGSRGLPAATGHIERFNPAIREARRFISDGKLGEPLAVYTRRHSQRPNRDLGTGVVLDLATHDIDCTRWITGQEYAQVRAFVLGSELNGDHLEDLVSVASRLDGGCLATHSVHWLSPRKERSFEVLGSEGLLVADLLMADLSLYAHGQAEIPWDRLSTVRGDREGSMVRFSFEKEEPLRLEHISFRDLVLGRPSDCASLEEGQKVVATAARIIDAANAS